MDPKELMEGLARVQQALKEGETHNGWLMNYVLHGLKGDPGVHVVNSHYTAEGITARIWLPSDKKFYRIDIKEDGRQKANLNPCDCEECQWSEREMARGNYEAKP